MSSDMNETAIEISNVDKAFRLYDRPADRLRQFFVKRPLCRKFYALSDVSFHVSRGETIGIIGVNGSGKSTLLQLVCGTLTASSGTIATYGRVAALLELGAGFDPEFTGRENVRLNASILGLTPAQIEHRMDDILAFADIGEFVDRPVKTYSSGMYVRLAFSVIAHVDADILVIDEALSVGDAFFTQKCMRFLRRFQQHGTVVFVSHDTTAVLGLCERAIWLDEGRLRQQGPAKDVCQAYMADMYRQAQGEDGTVDAIGQQMAEDSKTLPVRDMRQDWLNTTPLRNDIEVFEFDPETDTFGKRDVVIESVRLTDPEGATLTWIVGGESVVLELAWHALAPLSGLIFGFMVKDRLGQTLFGDNTFLVTGDEPIQADTGERGTVRFGFRMPMLPSGHYAVAASVADGSQTDHVQHHWLHEALVFTSHSSSVSTGLVGIPMHTIEVERHAHV